MGKKRARKREGHTHLPPHLPSSRVCLPPPSPTHPLTPDFLLLMSPPLPPSCPPSSALSPSPPPCHSLLLACLPHSLLPPPSPHLAFQARLRLTRHDDRLIHPFFFLFFFPPPVLKPLGREREKDRGSVNTAITALLKHRWRR